MFKFLTRRHFLINLFAAFALVIGLMFLFLWSLGFITNHGDFQKVPPVRGKLLAEAIKTLEGQGFKVEVQDSLYLDSVPPFSVIKQSPEPDMLVKSNRTVYLTINRSQPPLVEVPNMVGFSFRNGEMYLKQLGLKLGDTTRKPDYARDAILEQIYKGEQIRAGTKIFMGSTVSFVLGSGPGEEIKVPSVVGMTFREAKALLNSMNLNIGAVVPDPGVTDSLNAYVYKQNPPVKTETPEGVIQLNTIREGQGVDVYLSREMRELPKDSVADKDKKKEE